MSELTTIANSLLRWAASDPQAAPLAVSAARDILCLAEAELRLSAMVRTASPEAAPQTLPQMFDRIRNTNRDCDEILDSISKMEKTTDAPPPPSISKEVGKRAVDRLVSLATSADSVGRYALASAVDELVVAVTSP